MGNWFGRSKVVHPILLDPHVRQDRDIKSGLIRLPSSSSSSSAATKLRVKVRMTTGQLKELVARADSSTGDSGELIGRLILQECLEGRLRAEVVPGQVLVSEYGRSLSAIKEE